MVFVFGISKCYSIEYKVARNLDSFNSWTIVVISHIDCRFFINYGIKSPCSFHAFNNC